MTDLRVDLEEICARLGFSQMPDVLEALANAVLRGHHLGVLAAEGSGRGALIGLAVLESCESNSEDVQALILASEPDSARRLASAVQRVAGPEGIRVSCPASPDFAGAGESVMATVLVGRPSDLLPEVRSGRCSLARLRLLVIDGVAAMHDLGEWESVEPILETLPADSRKMAISDRADPGFADLLDRQFPRARRWPEELLPVVFDPKAKHAPEESRPAVLCGLAPRTGFTDALELCIRDADRMACSNVDIVCVGEPQAAGFSADLNVGGRQTELDGATVHVELPGEGEVAVVQAGLPFRLDEFASAFEGSGPRYAVVEPRHGPQLDLLLRRSGRRMEVLPGAALHQELDPIQRYRVHLRQEATHSDLLSELLVLEPLFEEIGAVRLAAVLSRMLRRRSDLPGSVRPWADVEEALTSDGGRSRSDSEQIPRGTRPAWTRLYFGVGRHDEAKPGDLVGAITGEAGIAGGQIGKIEIMGNFSIVDIDSQVADEVIARLDGAMIRGRSVPVRQDRNP